MLQLAWCCAGYSRPTLGWPPEAVPIIREPHGKLRLLGGEMQFSLSLLQIESVGIERTISFSLDPGLRISAFRACNKCWSLVRKQKRREGRLKGRWRRKACPGIQ